MPRSADAEHAAILNARDPGGLPDVTDKGGNMPDPSQVSKRSPAVHEIQEHPRSAAEHGEESQGTGLTLNEIFSPEMEARVHEMVVGDRRHGLLPVSIARNDEGSAPTPGLV
ncbi:hypothetical protein O7599_23040 [Streptomyces sp. WMMC500]|uniref:hypothetical protein n=1 Tax=Streptomyces sp. WMMC500 TaxID=3015154 RepID=UPI00248AE333|nr:hypothetical protein [Streptomyces sp. WMMC500]WBB58502.1 hypothetical protein O7599_23040 [Streptomyces sp. WMMC500]